MINTSSLFVNRAGVIRPDLIPLAAFLCAEEYDDYARSIILDHAAAGAPLADLTRPTPEGWVVLEPHDLAGAEEALRRGGPAPAPIAGFLADQLDRLAQLVAFTGAQSPRDFADRIEIHERDLLAREYDRGFTDGQSRTAGYCPR